jgi:glutathione peroxidase
MSLLDQPIARLDGTASTLREIAEGRAVLVVNVASRCGLTPQYAGLERLHEEYAGRGFTVIGVPCNQFLGQEPGSSDEIAEFCSATYGVTFPMTEKVDVNGDARHPIFSALADAPNEAGASGDVTWNFEKWLLDASGDVVARFSPGVEPEDPRIVEAVTGLL